jgi:hypothetical protein
MLEVPIAGSTTSGSVTWQAIPDPDGSPTYELAYDDSLVSGITYEVSGPFRP